MMENSPCKDCTERHTACHGSCEKYKEWLERYHAQQKHLTEMRNRFEIPHTEAREAAVRGYIKSGKRLFNHGGMK